MVVFQYIVGILVILAVIYSLYHCSTNKEMNRNEKLAYVILIIILPVIGMIIYFRKDQRKLHYKRITALQNAKKSVKIKKDVSKFKNS